jgi:hypothetical protein
VLDSTSSEAEGPRDSFERQVDALVRRRVTGVDYWDLHNYGPEPARWDYGDWHRAVMGVQLRTDAGSVTVTWTNRFFLTASKSSSSPSSTTSTNARKARHATARTRLLSGPGALARPSDRRRSGGTRWSWVPAPGPTAPSCPPQVPLNYPRPYDSTSTPGPSGWSPPYRNRPEWMTSSDPATRSWSCSPRAGCTGWDTPTLSSRISSPPGLNGDAIRRDGTEAPNHRSASPPRLPDWRHERTSRAACLLRDVANA